MRFSPRFPLGQSGVLLCAFVVAIFAGCGKPPDKNRSNESLKQALFALDRGDDAAAEKHLQNSLSANPKNARARTALASIYAKRAGFPLKEWLDPLLEAGKQVDSKLKAYDRASEVFRRLEMEERQADAEAADLLRAGRPGPEGRGGKSLAENDKYELKKRIVRLYHVVGIAAVGAMITIDLFQRLPFSTTAQLTELDRAIRVLRDDDHNPDQRQEAVRVYLAALSMVRFIQDVRSFVGSFDHEASKIFTRSSRICRLDADDSRKQIKAIRTSLSYVEEGLRVPEHEATTPALKARRELHDFVRGKVIGGAWDDIEKFFEQGTYEHTAAMRYLSRVCGAGAKPDGAVPPPVPGTGANLFNPDEP